MFIPGTIEGSSNPVEATSLARAMEDGTAGAGGGKVPATVKTLTKVVK